MLLLRLSANMRAVPLSQVPAFIRSVLFFLPWETHYAFRVVQNGTDHARSTYSIIVLKFSMFLHR